MKYGFMTPSILQKALLTPSESFLLLHLAFLRLLSLYPCFYYRQLRLKGERPPIMQNQIVTFGKASTGISQRLLSEQKASYGRYGL